MPFPTNEDICNLALSRIGQWQIANIMLDAEMERHCRLHLPQARRSLLRRFPWGFAIKRVELAASANPGYGSFTRYDLPADYIQTVTIAEDDGWGYQIDSFRIEGQTVLACSETAFLEYVADIEDPAKWSADFTDCVVLKLGSRLCIPLGAPMSRGQELLQELEQLAFPEATINSSREDNSGENNPTQERLNQSAYLNANRYEI